MRTILLTTPLLVLLLLAGCQREPISNGVAPLDFGDRPTYRDCGITTPLADGWEAGVSQGYFTDEPDEKIDFLEITLEHPQGDGNIIVPFEAAYSLKDLPPDILDKTPEELVTFDAIADSVVFDLGTTRVETKIPR